MFADCVNNSIIDTTGYSIVAGGVTTQATGVFTGSQGVSVGVTATQYPLRGQAADNALLEPVTPKINPLAIPAAEH